jgi:hypothetical protein
MTQQSGSGFSQFFTGEVRDIRDPDKTGKVKLMIHGHHNAGPTPIADADLPWCHSIHNNEASLHGVGATTRYLPGTTVVGFWLDPETKQIPFIIGSFHKAGITQSGQ